MMMNDDYRHINHWK